MRQWFPFTDYDFYGYLTSGMLLIAIVDYAFMEGRLSQAESWTFVEVGFWIAIAYVVGQILASPSATILEHLVMRRLLTPPASIQLGKKTRNGLERILAAIFAPREYAPLPLQTLRQVESIGRVHLNLNNSDEPDPQAIFIAGHTKSLAKAEVSARLAQFLNLYGFCRNLSFTALLGSIILLWSYQLAPTQEKTFLLAATLIISIGMFGRFLKFYAAYSGEALRCLGSVE